MWLVEEKKSTEVEYESVGEVEKGREVENVESRVEKVECVGRCQGLKWSHVALWQ